jgi:mannose-6-phosphate isomerase-like protein (cupin superfamily)
METTPFFKDYGSFTTFRPDRYGKSTLFENEYVLAGLNCLEAGQAMEKHAHQVQTRFYIVLEGKGRAWVGSEQSEIEPGKVIWVPPGHAHRLENSGNERLVLLIAIAPAHAD